MLCGIVKKWVNLGKTFIQNINRRKRTLVTTKTWGLIIVDHHYFSSTVFLYDNQTVRVKLHCSLMHSMYQRDFSCKTTIIDDVMLELQSQQHTKQELLLKGFIYATY